MYVPVSFCLISWVVSKQGVSAQVPLFRGKPLQTLCEVFLNAYVPQLVAKSQKTND